MARSARAIFDAVRGPLSLGGADRRVLENAARVMVGAGPTEPQSDSRALRVATDVASLAASGENQQPRRGARRSRRATSRKHNLAAILRVARALDETMLQDTSVVTCRLKRKKGLEVRLRGVFSRLNGERASAAADLWHEVMPFGVAIHAARSRPPQIDCDALVTADDSVGDAAWRLFRAYCCLALACHRGAAEGRDDEYLHAMRGALRRLRVVQRLFRPLFEGADHDRLRAELKTLCSRLGRVRDEDVWSRYLRKWVRAGAVAGSNAVSVYVAAQARRHRRCHKEARQVLVSERSLALLKRLDEVSRMAPKSGVLSATVAAYGAKRLTRSSRAIVRRQVPTSPESLHRLRSRVRRGRYQAEFLAPALGRPCERLAVVFRRAANALGAVHDMDVVLAGRNNARPAMPGTIVRRAREHRAAAMRSFVKQWKQLCSHEFGTSVLRELKRARKERRVRVYVVRHGIAVELGEKGAGTDYRRALSGKGKRKTEGVATALQLLGWVPRSIVSSPLVRARQTARILARHVNGRTEVVLSEKLGFGMDPLGVLRLLARHRAGEVAVVGHMPGLSELVSVMVSGSDTVSVPLKKAGVCCVSFPGRVRAGEGQLEWLLQPKQLVRMVG